MALALRLGPVLRTVASEIELEYVVLGFDCEFTADVDVIEDVEVDIERAGGP